MEKIALAPLHILFGLVNRLYNEARPSDSASSRRDRQLYKHHFFVDIIVYRSEYWNATLESNSCSRLIDYLDDIQFANSSVKFLNAIKTLKRVEDRAAWRDASIPWSP